MNFFSLPPLLTLLCFAGLALLTLRQGIRNRANLFFLILCIIGLLLQLDILIIFNVEDQKTAYMVSRIDHIFLVFSLPLYIAFFHEYLGLRKRKWPIYISLAASFLFVSFLPSSMLISGMQRYFFGYFAKGGPVYPLFGVTVMLVVSYVLFILRNEVSKERSSIRKNRLKYVLAGFAGVGVLTGLNVLPVLGYGIYPPGGFSFIPLVIFGFGVLRFDLLDMGLVIQKSLVYSLLTGGTTLAYSLLILLGERLLGAETYFKNSVFFQVSFFFLIILVIGPLKSRTNLLIDKLFDRERYRYRKIVKDASREVAFLLDVKAIADLLVKTVYRAMAVNSCALCLINSKDEFEVVAAVPDELGPQTPLKDSGIAMLLSTKRQFLTRKQLLGKQKNPEAQAVAIELEKAGFENALGLFFRGRMTGIFFVGEKESGQLFSREDIDLLMTLANQASVAIENARAYKEIETINQGLERLIEERTYELKAALEEKERTQEQLVRSESLAAIGQLVAGTAHEMNNPLASATSLVQTAIEEIQRRDFKEKEILLEDLEVANQELRRARSIVSSLLDLSRQTQTYSEIIDLNMVVKDALKVLRNQYKLLPVVIEKELEEELYPVVGNFANLGQAVLNIIKNALDALPSDDGRIRIRTSNGKGRVIFFCSDNGMGISPEIRSKIFKPFFTTKPPGKGTGLGLYICHEIIKKHEGEISVGKDENGWTLFSFWLPRKV